MSRLSSNKIREELVVSTINDIRANLPARHFTIGNFKSEHMYRLIKLIEKRVGEYMLKFIEKKLPISIPYIGVIRIHKMRLTYMELEQDLLEQFGVSNYDDLTYEERNEYDNLLAKLAREYKIKLTKKYQREYSQKVHDNFVENMTKLINNT